MLAPLLAAGCGAGEEEGAKARDAAPARISNPIGFTRVSSLRLGTPRAIVVRQIGRPARSQKVRPYGVVARCFRYLAMDEATGQIDPRYEFRLCYDRRDRLSFKSTAPPG